MFNAVGHDDELALSYDCLAVAEFHPQRALDHEEHFILMVVVMPNEFTLEPCGLHVKIVQLTDDFGAPAVGEAAELFREIDRVHELTLFHYGIAKDCERFPLRNRERAASFPACRSQSKCAARFLCPTRGPSP